MNVIVALVDDHVLLRNGLCNLLKDFGYTISFEAGNGTQLIEKLTTHPVPQVVLMDINMPQMDGLETTLWLKQHYPEIKVLALSMLDDEATILKMIRNGAKGYILKDCEPDELNTAIIAVLQKGFYHSELLSGKLMQGLSNGSEEETKAPHKQLFNVKELEFINWACTELSYKEIADKMKASPRTIDGYRDAIQEKIDVKGRIGIVLYAFKNGLVKM